MAGDRQTWRVLGLMSGTSLDGVDACVADITFKEVGLDVGILHSSTTPFNAEMRHAITKSISGGPDDLAALHYQLGAVYADVAAAAAQGQTVQLVGLHGQTVAHADGQFTLQMGSAALVAQRLGLPVVSNFREADIAAGGRGAPLMPYLDWLLCAGRSEPMLTLNLGGIANLGYVPAGAARHQVGGFDTGPGMQLIDQCAQRLFGQPIDGEGQFSRTGQVDEALLSDLMSQNYIAQAPPKSTGTDIFGAGMVGEIIAGSTLPPADILRTLVRFTARSVAENVHNFVPPPEDASELAVSGGGVHHPLLMADLAAEMPGWNLVTSAILGVEPDIKEALLMAVLAAAHRSGLPGNMPGVTGAESAVVLGQLTLGETGIAA